MNFTLNQLLIFVRVCEVGSITKASESLHMTQPAVSIQLKNFQAQFSQQQQFQQQLQAMGPQIAQQQDKQRQYQKNVNFG